MKKILEHDLFKLLLLWAGCHGILGFTVGLFLTVMIVSPRHDIQEINDFCNYKINNASTPITWVIRLAFKPTVMIGCLISTPLDK